VFLELSGEKMVWNSFGDFLTMGGYGPFVWGAAGVTAGFMCVEVVVLIIRKGSSINQLSISCQIGDDIFPDPPQEALSSPRTTDRGGRGHES
jgi:heme exporter protein D